MGGLGDCAIENLLQCVDPLSRDGVFVVHEMHRERRILEIDNPMLTSVDNNDRRCKCWAIKSMSQTTCCLVGWLINLHEAVDSTLNNFLFGIGESLPERQNFLRQKV